MRPPPLHSLLLPTTLLLLSGGGRRGGAAGCPPVGAGFVSPAGVEIAAAIIAAPDDHFAAGPHCRVIVSASGRAGGAGRCPTVGAGIRSEEHISELQSPDHLVCRLLLETNHCVSIPSAGRPAGAGVWRASVSALI